MLTTKHLERGFPLGLSKLFPLSMKNFSGGTFRVAVFLCISVAVMALLRCVPVFNVGNYEVKPVDILSDVVEENVDSTPSVEPTVAVVQDTCPAGVTCIEDYGVADTCHGMRHFYEMLAQRQSIGRPVRIAFFGDSFIEGDIFTADLRELLQAHFGGTGVGYVDIASPFTKLRTTVNHTATGWTEHSVLDKSGCDKGRLGISGRYAVSGGGAKVSYQATNSFPHVSSFEVATLYLAAGNPVTIGSSTSSDATESLENVSGGWTLQTVQRKAEVGQSLQSISFNVKEAGATCYGVALEGREGVTLDNFSLRGCSGAPLSSIPQEHLRQLNTVRPYDLIVLQFGLNVANKKTMNYDYYVRQMRPVIEHFRTAFPEASLLVVSIGDREDRIGGKLRTLPGVLALLGSQQSMAADEGIAFWNLYEAMGGEGGIRRMAEAKPAEANKDYTHINRLGGKRIATALYNALLHGYDQYTKNHTP